MVSEHKDEMNEESQNRLIEDMRNLLFEGQLTTQEGVCAALASMGYSINQSKTSRLLRKVGAIKSKNEKGQIVYRLPLEPAPPTALSQLSSLVIDIMANEVNIIVSTSPGSAQLIARILDYHKKEIQILGSIAGDDTLFIAPKSTTKIGASLQKIKDLLTK